MLSWLEEASFLYAWAHGRGIVSHDIEVMNSGVMKLRREDMIVVFFVTIHHHGEKARNVMATMVECCEKINDDDTDCNIIQVFGEHLGLIQPGTTHNVTFIYPNIYSYNRRGSCIVDIWNRKEEVGVDDTNQIRHRIDFDTSIRGAGEDVPPYLQGLYNPDKIVRCETTDLDPLDGCNPVNCRLKYSGLRNFFNRKRKRCQQVPKCIGDPNKELPDVVYVPMSNTCQNLEEDVGTADVIDLIKGNYEVKSRGLEGGSVNIQCHHGEIDVRTGLCVCDKGWTSEPFDPEKYSQSNSMYHMCDKKCHPDDPKRLSKVPFAIGAILAFFIVGFVIVCEVCNWHYVYGDLVEDDENEEVSYYAAADR